MDNGRDRLIKAQTGLRAVGDSARLQRGLSHVLDVPVQSRDQGLLWANIRLRITVYFTEMWSGMELRVIGGASPQTTSRLRIALRPLFKRYKFAMASLL